MEKSLAALPLLLLITGCVSTTNTGSMVAVETSEIKIPLSDVGAQAKFYDFSIENKPVRFFAVEGNDGIIRTAFDACDVCGGRKGYRQEGNDMVCNNCGRHFAIDSLGTKNLAGGGCWPTYLPHETNGEYIIIDENDLSNMRGVFG